VIQGVNTTYPAEFETEVPLRDGSTVHVRPLTGSDESALAEFLASLSLRSRAFRFFSAGSDPAAAARRAVRVDYHDTFGLVAESGGRIVGHAMYGRSKPDTVEVAFAVADDLQGFGLGTVMLAHIAAAAAANGFEILEAEVLPENHRMLEVFSESGFPLEIRAEPGVVHLRTTSSISTDILRAFERREHTSGIAAVGHILKPSSVALVGASRDRGRVGGAIFHNLIDAGFSGAVYPVNRAGGAVQGVRAYKSLREIPDPIELAVIAVPAEHVVDVAHDAAACDVKALVVVTAGFAEEGPEGRARQDQLVSICRESGMRIVGPNCLGVLSTADDIRLNATFSRGMPPAGPLSLLSQSGALGLAAIDQAAERGLGLASFVSAGNKADVSGNDVLEFWEDDPNTGVIALYLESFGNPRTFARVARRVSKSKPIVAVKSGRSAAGARAAASHTGAALAASDMTVDALFQQAGVIRAGTLGELLDVSALLGTQPLPPGKRVAVLTNSGGPGILTTDALEAEGMELAELSARTGKRLKQLLPAAASVANPVDMLATASPDLYTSALEILVRDDSVDAIIAIYTPTGLDDPDDVLQGLALAADVADGRIPIAAVALTPNSGGSVLRGEKAQIPVYAFPEDAVWALAHASRLAEWRARPEGHAPDFDDLEPERATAILASGLADGGGWLEPGAVEDLLRCYGIPLVESRVVSSAAAAGRAAAEFGGRIALKAIAPGLVHKTEVDAVRLGLTSPTQVRRVAGQMVRELATQGIEVEALLVQRMVESGVEMLIGVVHDPLFGPVVVAGAGGTAVELLHDVSARITPLTDEDAREQLRSLKTYPLLEGYRGAPRADIEAVEDVLLRIGRMVETHAEIAELDLNPVIATPDGVFVVDARVRVEQSQPRAPWPAIGSTPPALPPHVRD
jgi:acetyl coenzyme A synthetase (ADP forming)-like protein